MYGVDGVFSKFLILLIYNDYLYGFGFIFFWN